MPNCYVVILGHCVRESCLTSNAISEAKRKSKATSFIATCLFSFSLPEIGDILRPRSIWHAVSNYQDGGMKKAVRRKNKD